jgi:hypothetical protein
MERFFMQMNVQNTSLVEEICLLGLGVGKLRSTG